MILFFFSFLLVMGTRAKKKKGGFRKKKKKKRACQFWGAFSLDFREMLKLIKQKPRGGGGRGGGRQAKLNFFWTWCFFANENFRAGNSTGAPGVFHKKQKRSKKKKKKQLPGGNLGAIEQPGARVGRAKVFFPFFPGGGPGAWIFFSRFFFFLFFFFSRGEGVLWPGPGLLIFK